MRKLSQGLWGTAGISSKANGITPPQQLALGRSCGQSGRKGRCSSQPSLGNPGLMGLHCGISGLFLSLCCDNALMHLYPPSCLGEPRHLSKSVPSCKCFIVQSQGSLLMRRTWFQQWQQAHTAFLASEGRLFCGQNSTSGRPDHSWKAAGRHGTHHQPHLLQHINRFLTGPFAP